MAPRWQLDTTTTNICFPVEVFSAIVTGALVAAMAMRPDLRRRQLSRIIMMQAIADCCFSTASSVSMLSDPCGPLLNKYCFMMVVFSSAWVAILAFHLAAQASGYWIEAERWGPRYLAFSAVAVVFFGLVSFGRQDFDMRPCFDTYPGGTRLNAQLAIAVVFSTVLWCTCCALYSRVFLGVHLYSTRFLAIYVLCWSPQILWFVCSWSGAASDSALDSRGWTVVMVLALAVLGIANAVAYGTMPPEFVLHRLVHALRRGELCVPPPGHLREGQSGGCGRCWWLSAGFGGRGGGGGGGTRGGDDVDGLRVGLLSAEVDSDKAIAFDAAADNFLASIVRTHGDDYKGLVLPPSTIKLGELLGSGAYGSVYAGTYNKVDVAVKEVHSGLQQDYSLGNPRNIKELFAEASMLTRARHQNIVSFVGISLGIGGRLLLVMELCPGTLRDYLADAEAAAAAASGEHHGPTSASVLLTKLRVCTEICQGLESLHDTLRVIHRDIKLDNIFVSSRGTVKLGDMGTACFIARVAERGVPRAGTPLYLAPEAFACAVWRVNTHADRIDIFAAAVTICEIFTGNVPYESVLKRFLSLKDLYDAVSEGLRPSTIGVPEPIAAVCQSGWSFFPAARPSAAELVKRFKELKSVEEWNRVRAQSHADGVADRPVERRAGIAEGAV